MSIVRNSVFTAIILLVTCAGLSAQKYYGKSVELPLTSITPQGWIKEFLQRQAAGLAGNPTVSGYPFNTNMWLEDIHIPVGHAGKELWPYEQTGYFLDGSLRCGYLINDTALINYARRNFEYTLTHVPEDGILGQPKADGWARAVYFRGLMAEYEVTKNPDILSKMTSHYLKTPRLFNSGRLLMNIEQILWLYGKTGNEKLLTLAEKSFHNITGTSLGGEYRKHGEDNDLPSKILDRMLSDRVPSGHGVGFIEQAKLPAILYLYTGNKNYLNATINAIDKLEKHHLLVDGVQSSVEHMSGKAVNMAHETCDIIDLTWSLGYLLMATNNGHWGDMMERAIFNAGLGSIDKHFKAHQYYSAPNQPIAAENTSQFNIEKSWGGMATGRMCFRTGHDTECCTGNIQRMMPVYVSRMWLENSDQSGVFAALYGASDFTFSTNGQEVKIEEQTNYPFDEKVKFDFSMNEKVNFAFSLRIPAWCGNPKVEINGKEYSKGKIEKGVMMIDRKFTDGDQITLTLPMEMKRVRCGEHNEGFAIERGPLVYSLPVENKTITFPYIGDAKLKDFPNKLMYPSSVWNYAFDFGPISRTKFVQQENQQGYVWDLEHTPNKIVVPVREVKNWKIDGTIHAPSFPDRLDLGEREEVTLVPLGATYLRMTVFPQVLY